MQLPYPIIAVGLICITIDQRRCDGIDIKEKLLLWFR
jgi:hypothetical protein